MNGTYLLLAMASWGAARFTEATDFHWAGGPGRQISWGPLSKPASNALVRAHFLTGEEQYLRAIVPSTASVMP